MFILLLPKRTSLTFFIFPGLVEVVVMSTVLLSAVESILFKKKKKKRKKKEKIKEKRNYRILWQTNARGCLP